MRMKSGEPSAVDAALSNTTTALGILKDVAETLKNVPYIKTIAGVSIQILEIKDQISSNKELCYRLINDVAARSMALVEALEQVQNNGGSKLKDLEKDLKRYKNLLIDIHRGLTGLTAAGLAKAIIRRDEIKKKLQDYSSRLTEFDSVFVFTRLVNIEAKIDGIKAHIPVLSSPTVTNLAPPPPPSDFFTGRQDVLAKMDKYFDPSTASVVCNRRRIFALYGMGGAGKTQIALKFIESHSKWFSKLYFVDASTTETMTTAFENIGLNAQLPKPTADATLRWLSNLKEEWLLFLDNADDPSLDLRPFIPKCSHGNLIITSRNPEMRRHTPDGHYNVGGLEPVEALSLLRRSAMIPAEDADEKHMTELIEELGFLALAIVQAGGFISSSPGMTFERYLELYKANKADLLSESSGQKVDGYQWTVYTTWEMSFRKLDSLAAQVLQISSFWHHDKIPKGIFQHVVFEMQKSKPLRCISRWDDAVDFVAHFQNTGREWNELTFQKVINQLHSFSLITSYWDDCYSIHPLVHSWARDRPETQKDHYAVLAARLLALCVPIYALRTRIGTHLRAWMTVQHDIYAYLDADLAFHLGKVCLHNSWWSEAERLYLFASERSDGDIGVIGQLVNLYIDTGRLADAEKLLSSAIDEASLSHGREHPDTLDLVDSLANIYFHQDRLNEAEELQRMVLDKRKKTLGERHFDTLQTMFLLGSTCSSQRQWKEAEELGTSALDGLKNAVGEEDPTTIWCMANLAYTYCQLGRLTEAEKQAVTALERAKRTLGDDHIDTLTIMTYLAEIYLDQGRSLEAQVLVEEVLSEERAILGENHRHTQASIRLLEKVKTRQKDEAASS